MRNYPLHPKHPERVCWGCDKFCPGNDLRCGKERAQHPTEVYGDSWTDEPSDADISNGDKDQHEEPYSHQSEGVYADRTAPGGCGFDET